MGTKKAKYFFISLLILANLVFSQKTKVDTLVGMLEEADHDTTRVFLYYQLSEYCELEDIPKNSGECIKLADKLLLDKKLQRSFNQIIIYKAFAYNNLGYYYSRKDNQAKTIENYLKALRLLEQIEFEPGIADILDNVFDYYYERNDYQNALVPLTRATALREKLKDTTGLVYSLNEYLTIYKEFGEQEKSLEVARRLLKIELARNRTDAIGEIYLKMGGIYRKMGDLKNSEDCFIRSIKEHEKTKNQVKLSLTYKNYGILLKTKGDIKGALAFLQKSLLIEEKNNKQLNIGLVLNEIGLVYKDLGDIKQALLYFNRALKLNYPLILGSKINKGHALINIGDVYFQQRDYESSLKYYKQGLKLFTEAKDLEGIALSYLHLGKVHEESGKQSDALSSFETSLTFYSEINNKEGKANAYSEIANLYSRIGQLEKALQYHNASLALLQELQIKYGISTELTSVGDIFLKQNLLTKAIDYAEQSMKIANELGFPELKRNVVFLLHKTAMGQKQYQKALNYYNRYLQLRDTILNDENSKLALRTQMEEEFMQKEQKLKEEQLLKDEKTKAEKKQQLIIIYSVSFSFIVVLILAFVILKNLRENKRKSIIITEQKKLVEDKNKDITDSINYAKKIQEALLPPKELKYELFPNAFILFQPRDIVSGDFYWFAAKNGKRIITAVDCTGHGVPGAFMSMIGNTFLNEIIMEKGITEPASILSELRHMVIKSLKQDGINAESKDGMDMALIAIDDKHDTLEFAGANNPLWIVRNGQCMEYTADKRPIGFFRGKGLPFTNHKIQLQKGDSVYLFTDGYADQFGGPKGKKFKYKQFQEILISIQNEPMLKQEEILYKRFYDWKGTLEQVDDVLVIGVKI